MLYPGSFILTSTMYPVEVFEEAVITPPSFGAEMREEPLDVTETAPPTFSGTHVQTLFSGAYVMPPEDFTETAPPTFSGTHVQTFFPVSYAMPPEDFSETLPPSFGGSHVQTLFPLAYLHEPQETVITPPTFNGSLA
jgi:hypothetical protein